MFTGSGSLIEKKLGSTDSMLSLCLSRKKKFFFSPLLEFYFELLARVFSAESN